MLLPQSAPDLLITLAAVEAVITAQACHLAPDQTRQLEALQQLQRWQHELLQQAGIDVDTNSLYAVLSDLTQYPLDKAPLLLLPFVNKFVLALSNVITGPDQQRLEALLADATSSVSNKLLVRLSTLLVTALKVSRCAIL